MHVNLSIGTTPRPASGNTALSDLVLLMHAEMADTVDSIFRRLEGIDPSESDQIAGIMIDAQELRQTYTGYSDVLHQLLFALLKQLPDPTHSTPTQTPAPGHGTANR